MLGLFAGLSFLIAAVFLGIERVLVAFGRESPLSLLGNEALLASCDLAGSWTREEARAWWVEKGQALAAVHHAETAPSALTLCRPRVERAG